MRPQLAVIYPPHASITPFRNFQNALNCNKYSVHLEARPLGGPFAGVMWTMVTGVAVFFASSYIGGILKELGKDHYELLKESLAKLTIDTMSHERIEPVLVGTSGKLKEGDPISMAFSVWAQVPSGQTVKLLVPKNNGQVDYASATSAFLDFMQECHEKGEVALIGAGVDISRRPNPITVIYNPESRNIEWADPFAH